MAEKCPCETYIKSCCACVSMHCDECHGHSKFVQGRFCSNCGRPLKAELTRLYVPKSEVEWLYEQVDCLSQEVMYNDDIAKMKVDEAKAEVAREIFEEIEKAIGKRLQIDDHMRTYGQDSSISYKTLAELKKKYTEGEE